MIIEVHGRAFEADERGYLRDWQTWEPAWAEMLAHRDGLALSPEHWQVLDFLREYYAEYKLIPPMRLLVRALGERLGAEKGSSRYLYRLFPQGPAQQACRYAGLPKPVSCI
jgi:tRNA 2-thiouridine synthesizing protein E